MMLSTAKAMDTDSCGWKETLLDGTQVFIRPISPNDRELERLFIEHLSPSARRFRFLETMKSPSQSLLTLLTVIDTARDVAFLAVLARPGAETEIGVARFNANAEGSDCELAVVVGDAWQRKGLGTLLIRRLIGAAQKRGISSMHAITANDNVAMQELGKHMGFHRTHDTGGGRQVFYRTTLPHSTEAVSRQLLP
jgi:GNAT superfamily N-acetyltransferase